ncbi:MAG: hypothetical protein AAF628_31970 [Planctomycetota bacterium]
MTPPPDRFAGTTPNPVQAGATLEVHFQGTGAGEVTVTATNGQGEEQEIKITLGADGKGTAEFDVPSSGWAVVILEHATSQDHAVVVSD